MRASNLHRLFHPRSVAVLGASDAVGKVGYTVLRNLIVHGFPGAVYPINPRRAEVQGLTCFASLDALPQTPDLVVVCTPASTVPGLVEQCGELRIPGVIILSAGFAESGVSGRELEAQLRSALARYPQVRMIGPNCLGVIVPQAKLSASFASGMPTVGRVALLSQSGALCTAILDWAATQQIGFSYFLSLGNMLDVGVADLLDYLADDAGTDSVVMYLESITHAREFMSAARAFARRKPIVVYKSGRFQESARAASSHTGAMAGVDDVYEAAFQRAGIVRVYDSDDLFGCAELLARARLPRGPRLGIVTNAGGPGVMACDALLAANGKLAKLSAETLQALNAALPAYWSHDNPVDVLGDASPERYATAVESVLSDPEVDAVLAILTPQAMTDPTETARAVGAQAMKSAKPLLAAWMGGVSVSEGVAALNAMSVPTFDSPERAVSAFSRLVQYAQRREVLLETPRSVPLNFTLPRNAQRARVNELLRTGAPLLSERHSKELLELYGIPVSRTALATTADEAARLARESGFPVVLKIESPQITHKSDVGGVRLNLPNEAAVREAFDAIIADARRLRPEAEIHGVTVQPMIVDVNGVPLIVGSKKDPVFGPVIMVGAGGVMAELLNDRALELPPLNERLASRMLESLQSWPLLNGYRGKPRIAVDRLIETLLRFSYLIADIPEIQEADVNPLIVTPEGAMAVDARFFVDSAPPPETQKRRFSHLAICPCPDELTQDVSLADGTQIVVRPLHPEDESLWRALLASASPETLRRRFGYEIGEVTHEFAARYCFLDYDRELALVAEVRNHAGPHLVGVGRLAVDGGGDTAEFAVLVTDAFQQRGLGTVLTNACVAAARHWGVREVHGTVALDNAPMIALFRDCGFQLEHSAGAARLRARLPLE